jgi:hypothetical protein
MPLLPRTLVQIVFLAATVAVLIAYAPRRRLRPPADSPHHAGGDG